MTSELDEDVILIWMILKELEPLLNDLRGWDVVDWFLENLRACAHNSGEGITQTEVDRFRMWNRNWFKMSNRLREFYKNSLDDEVMRWALSQVLDGKTKSIKDGMRGYVYGRYQERYASSSPENLFPDFSRKRVRLD